MVQYDHRDCRVFSYLTITISIIFMLQEECFPSFDFEILKEDWRI